jgi:hypothetical protein
MKVPRALMGEKGNQLVNNLVMQVNNKGVPMKVGDVVDLNVKMGGFIKNQQSRRTQTNHKFIS